MIIINSYLTTASVLVVCSYLMLDKSLAPFHSQSMPAFQIKSLIEALICHFDQLAPTAKHRYLNSSITDGLFFANEDYQCMVYSNELSIVEGHSYSLIWKANTNYCPHITRTEISHTYPRRQYGIHYLHNGLGQYEFCKCPLKNIINLSPITWSVKQKQIEKHMHVPSSHRQQVLHTGKFRLNSQNHNGHHMTANKAPINTIISFLKCTILYLFDTNKKFKFSTDKCWVLSFSSATPLTALVSIHIHVVRAVHSLFRHIFLGTMS